MNDKAVYRTAPDTPGLLKKVLTVGNEDFWLKTLFENITELNKGSFFIGGEGYF